MVDHSANENGSFREARASGEQGGWATVQRTVSRWLNGDGPVSRLRLWAAVASVVWLAAVGAYGIGFHLRLSEGGATGALPTLDLLFFVFAAIGPVAMLWIAVAALLRADRVADALTAQGESALALAAHVANLNDTLEVLASDTVRKVEAIGATVERESRASVGALDEALASTSKRLDKVLRESAVVIDDRVAKRIDALMKTLEAQRAALDERLTGDAQRLGSAVEGELDALVAMKAELGKQIEDGADETRTRLERAQASALEAQTGKLAESIARLEQGLADVSQRVADAHGQHAKSFETDVVTPLRGLRATVAETQASLAAHPPASADELARLVGAAAERMLTADRKALEAAVARLDTLEDRSAKMLALIDRTSRLNPLMDVPRPPTTRARAAATPEAETAELPFEVLPKTAARAALNWSAVVRFLDGAKPQRANRQTLAQVAADPDVADVARLRDQIGAALAEERVHLEDLRPEHGPAELWVRFAEGARGAEVASLGAVSDEVALALVRARLRNDEDFHALSLRLIAAYLRLLGRATADMGADPKLVELAETSAGRAFVLLGGLLRVFEGPVAGDVVTP